MQRDHFFPIAPETLLSWILADINRGEIFGISERSFFVPQPNDPFQLRHYGQLLETPIGVAAGPHTQMAQNIIAAWLCGARWIELKTVQILDELTITKPCIIAADEGYNCEWSQELRLDESFDQYLLAHVLIHLLRHRLGFSGSEPGFASTMSIGYDYAGILSSPMQRFLNRMTDCHLELATLLERLTPLYPALADLEISPCLANSLTLSTMHGCPPGEIKRIGHYFLEERRLPTAIKLNPTLLGPERVRGIVNETLGFDVEIPDTAFSHDLTMPQALELIHSLQDTAARAGTYFSLKLTNTLETVNRCSGLPAAESIVYLSGRPLHPVGVALADALQTACGGSLDISFCAGVDLNNVVDILASGLMPVTVCTDLLKPGGYERLRQYLDVLARAMTSARAKDLPSLARIIADDTTSPAETGTRLPGSRAAALTNLRRYATVVVADSHYYKEAAPNRGRGVTKPTRPLPRFDCAVAPCRLACPAGQDIPRYLDFAARGRLDLALTTILATNPLPTVLGQSCDRQCRKYCVRGYYDAPLAIREIKSCAAKIGNSRPTYPEPTARTDRKVTVLGAGPAGLSCAWYLAIAGYNVAVYETKAFPGGQLDDGLTVCRDAAGQPIVNREAVATFFVDRRGKREAALATAADLNMLLALGVTLQTGSPPTNVTVIEARPDMTMTIGPGALPAAVAHGRRLAATWLEQQNAAGQLPAAPADDRPRDAVSLAKLAQRKTRRNPALPTGSRNICTPDTAAAEASRCLQCDLICNLCVTVCPNRANLALPVAPRRLPLQQATRDSGRDDPVRVKTLGYLNLTQPFQVINLADLCNACGNCATFCPSSGTPFRDKPRWHLTAESFAVDREGCFLAAPDRLEAIQHGQVVTLSITDERWCYASAILTAELDPLTFEAKSVELAQGIQAANLDDATELALLYTLVAGRRPFV